MALSFKYLSEIVGNQDLVPNLDRERRKGGFRWTGPHFSAFVRYAIALPSNYYNLRRFSDLLRTVERLACRCKNKNHSNWWLLWVKFSEAMDYFLPNLKEFFAVPKPEQYFSDSTPKTNELVAIFIDFLIEAVEKFLSQTYLSRFITVRINHLLKDLKFLLFILGDTPLRCTELQETKNIMAEIESVANEAGSFVHSFFFTTDLVKDAKIASALSAMLPKFKTMKENIKKHCITVSNLPSVTTPNTALVSIFIVDSVLDYLHYLINNKARLIVDVKDQITTLHEELNDSRSFLGDIEVHQDKELIQCVMQLRDLAYEAEYIISWFVTGDVFVWYLNLRFSNFIQKNKLIRAAFPEIKLNHGINSLEVAESPCEVSLQVAKSIPIVDEIFVGLKDEIKRIASQLVRGPDQLQIISITGMPGLGKTTLAKKLYNDSSIISHFDIRLWCVVSQTYQRKRLLIDLLRSINLNEDKYSVMKDEELGEILYKNLKERRFFIVMDDIWNVEAWDDLKMYIPKDKTRSRILFTSRNKHVAFQASSDGIINELPFLSVDECWDLLHRKVFQKTVCPPELEDVGMQIVTSCKGVPLAVAGIAAVLAKMEKKESLWREVLASLTCYISKDLDILELSYEHLPIHLKPCFLYFGAFEEDREIPVKKLLSLWISEGFIKPKKDCRPEDVAEEYLFELIDRSMVQIAKRRLDNGIKACNIHDLMRDMSLRIAKEENFLKVIQDGFSIYEQHHRLCKHSYPRDVKSRLFGSLHIRSLFGISGSSFIISSLRLLRVILPVSNDYPRGNMESLVQLRYLETPYIPHRLENLEFLIVTKETCVDPDIFNMPKLRHIKFKHHSGFSYWSTDRNYYYNSKTSSIETLSGVYIPNEYILGLFPHLRRLKCCYKHPRDHCSDLSFLTKLESLSITFLAVQIKVINFPTNIKNLTLSGGFPCDMMSSIGKLPNLETLTLKFRDFEEQNWETNDEEFLKLKFLKLRSFKFGNWNTSKDHFPSLERLVLERCNFKKIPSELVHIPTLQMIEVNSCCISITKSANEMKEELEEIGIEEPQVIIFTENLSRWMLPNRQRAKTRAHFSSTGFYTVIME